VAQVLTEDAFRLVLPEWQEIRDPALREATFAIWAEFAREMPWRDVAEVPKDDEGGKDCSLVDHIRGVTRSALAIGESARDIHGQPYDRDTVVAACLLHDVSKLIEFEPDPENDRPGANLRACRKSEIGRKVQHAVYAAAHAIEHGVSLDIINLIITHTRASNMRGTTWEAAILYYADSADTDAVRAREGLKLVAERRPNPWTNIV
jgi:putative nucleotidyltransferase with HDIG domain